MYCRRPEGVTLWVYWSSRRNGRWASNTSVPACNRTGDVGRFGEGVHWSPLCKSEICRVRKYPSGVSWKTARIQPLPIVQMFCEGSKIDCAPKLRGATTVIHNKMTVFRMKFALYSYRIKHYDEGNVKWDYTFFFVKFCNRESPD